MSSNKNQTKPNQTKPTDFVDIKLIFFLSFLVEHYTIKINIIRYYQLPNSTALKLFNEKYDYIAVKKLVHT